MYKYSVCIYIYVCVPCAASFVGGFRLYHAI